LIAACTSLQERLSNSPDQFRDLEFEADVLATKRRSRAFRKRKRLVDQKEYARDWTLWAELLQFRRRTDGDEGVAQIWKRLVNEELPTEGPAADILWKHILDTANKGKTITLEEVVEKAAELRALDGRQSTLLYPTIIGHVFRHRPNNAAAVFRGFRQSLTAPPDALRSIVGDVVLSSSPEAAWRSFKQIYSTHKEKNIYDHALKTLLRIGTDLASFYTWHEFLVKNNDFPSAQMRQTPTVQACLAQDQKDAATSDASAGKSAPDLDKLTDEGRALLTRQGMSKHVGEVHGIKEKSLSDDFCARLFATRSFSLDFIFGSIYMLGANSLGPLAMREMALRSDNNFHFHENLHKARSSGLSISKSTFSEVLRFSATEERQQLFDFIVNGDFHPDAIGSHVLQAEIVKLLINHGVLEDVYSFLKIVSLTTEQTHHWPWNELAQACCREGEEAIFSRVMCDMRARGIKFDHKLVTGMKQTFLDRRNVSKRPIPRPRGGSTLDYDVFVSSHMLLILEGGQRDLKAAPWRELLKRFGMAGRIAELHDLTVELARYYGPRNDGKQLGESSYTVKDSENHDGKQLEETSSIPDETQDRDGKRVMEEVLPTVIDSQEDAPQVTSHETRSLHSDHFLFSLNGFSPSSESTDSGEQAEGQDDKNLFDEVTQRAIVAWGFWHESYKKKINSTSFRSRHRGLQSSSFTNGLQILRRLEAAGISLYVDAIRDEVRKCLFKLYGPGQSARPRMRRLKSSNRYSLEQRFALVEKAWKGLEGKYEWENFSSDASSGSRSTYLYYYLFKDFMLSPKWAPSYSAEQLQMALMLKEEPNVRTTANDETFVKNGESTPVSQLDLQRLATKDSRLSNSQRSETRPAF